MNDIKEKAALRVRMFGGALKDDAAFDYCVERSLREALDFCNSHEFPDEAGIYLADWAAANYLTETDGYSKQWERLRKDAERGLIRYRRMIW
jgi:hypothetical protein